jgi:flagellar biosynthesis/type III secretory pathway M-ring protein FliF/YscJ
MAEQSVNQPLPEISGKIRSNNRSAYFATISTAILALVLILMLWIYNPGYVVLIQNLDPSTLSRVTSDLQKSNIAYQYDSQTGNILVPEKSLYQAKFVLGSKGLEQSSMSRLLFDMKPDSQGVLEKQGVPTKYFALETELARTISSIKHIQWARVHLAVSDSHSTSTENKSRASVFVKLAEGRSLGESQISSISHLIAASVSNLSTENITIIDQSGNLLKSRQDGGPASSASMRYSYVRILEQSYISKLEAALTPIFGENALRIRVDADVEFKDAQQPNLSIDQSQSSHTIKKITATVVVDNKLVSNSEGQQVGISRSKKEIDKIETLVKQAIGFDQQRGDRVSVFNEPFGVVTDIRPRNNSIFFFEQNQTYYLTILILALFGLLGTYFVLRYLVYKIMKMKPVSLIPEAVSETIEASPASFNRQGEIAQAESDELAVISSYEALLTKTRQQVNNNPAHVAKVIKTWVRDNER